MKQIKPTTPDDLLKAKLHGTFTLTNDTLFFLNRNIESGDLKAPVVIIKENTVVFVHKTYRKGRAALLCYIDKSGKVWWSWKHAEN